MSAHHYVPVDEVLRHMNRLAAAGVSYNAICRAARVPAGTVFGVKNGHTHRIYADAAERILGVTTDDCDDSYVSAWRVQRLVAEMRKAGVTNQSLCDAMKKSTQHGLNGILGPNTVQRKTFRQFVLIYRHLAAQGVVPASVLEEVS